MNKIYFTALSYVVSSSALAQNFVDKDADQTLRNFTDYVWAILFTIGTLLGLIACIKPGMSYFNDNNEEAIIQIKNIALGYGCIVLLPSIVYGGFQVMN